MTDLDLQTLAWLRRTHEMSTLTIDHSVREHWKWWHERTPGRVDIVIHANVSWESNLDSEVDLGIGWIRPTLYEPVRVGPPFELPVKELLRLHRMETGPCEVARLLGLSRTTERQY